MKKIDLKEAVDLAQKKLNLSNITDLKHYLPDQEGFRLHPLTMHRLLTSKADELSVLIQKHILEVEKPVMFPSKPRAPRRKKEKNIHSSLSTQDLLALLELAEKSEKKELAQKLRADLPFKALQRELLQSIRAGNADTALWQAYQAAVEMC